MKIERVKIADLKSLEKNTRIHNRRQIDEFVRSLNMFGQIRPAVVDEHNVVWCGNGMMEAAKIAGWTELDVYRVVGLTEAQKNKLMLADNQIFTLGATNTMVMDEILTEMQDFDIPGYDSDMLEQLYGSIEVATAELQSYGVVNDESLSYMDKVTENRNAASDERVYTYSDVGSAAPAAHDDYMSDESLVPKTIRMVDGMVNVPKDNNTRPFIICPKCGEKIWL